MAKKAVKGFDTQVSIHILSKRYRLCDADGISAKAVIDGLVHETVIANDSQKEVSEVSYSQEKIKKDIQEETILTITEG